MSPFTCSTTILTRTPMGWHIRWSYVNGHKAITHYCKVSYVHKKVFQLIWNIIIYYKLDFRSWIFRLNTTTVEIFNYLLYKHIQIPTIFVIWYSSVRCSVTIRRSVMQYGSYENLDRELSFFCDAVKLHSWSLQVVRSTKTGLKEKNIYHGLQSHRFNTCNDPKCCLISILKNLLLYIVFDTNINDTYQLCTCLHGYISFMEINK